MLPLYVKEFIAICNYLEAHNCPCAKGFFLVKREALEMLLNKNTYEKPQNKLKTWKALHWTNAENRRLTKRLYDAETKTYHPHVLIDITVYQTLKGLDTS